MIKIFSVYLFRILGKFGKKLNDNSILGNENFISLAMCEVIRWPGSA